MINYLIKIITTLWFIFFCLQVSVAQEIDVNQTRKHLLQTLQDNSVDKQQRMELYIDLYDLSDDVTSKRTYINESLQLAIQLKIRYIFLRHWIFFVAVIKMNRTLCATISR